MAAVGAAVVAAGSRPTIVATIGSPVVAAIGAAWSRPGRSRRVRSPGGAADVTGRGPVVTARVAGRS